MEAKRKPSAGKKVLEKKGSPRGASGKQALKIIDAYLQTKNLEKSAACETEDGGAVARCEFAASDSGSGGDEPREPDDFVDAGEENELRTA